MRLPVANCAVTARMVALPNTDIVAEAFTESTCRTLSDDWSLTTTIEPAWADTLDTKTVTDEPNANVPVDLTLIDPERSRDKARKYTECRLKI